MTSNWVSRMVTRICTASALTVLTCTCQSAANQSPPAPSVVTPSAAPLNATADEVLAVDRIEEDSFQLSWTLTRPPAGDRTAGAGELVLTSKAPFKCNQDYPYKLKLTALDASPGKPEITKPDMQVGKDRVVVPVSFEVKGPNPTLEGTLAFSVCTDDKCLIERKSLRLSVRGPSDVQPSVGSAASVVGAPTVMAPTTSGK